MLEKYNELDKKVYKKDSKEKGKRVCKKGCRES